MSRTSWNRSKIKQFELEAGGALLTDEQTLHDANRDFGRLVEGQALAVFDAQDLSSLQSLLRFAHANRLPVTVRANGLTQSGQSLSPAGGLAVDIRKLNDQLEWIADNCLRAGCGVSWKSLAQEALTRSRLPRVYPYNTNLTVGGVISVGGVGSTSFKEGLAAAHVSGLRVLLADGELVSCDRETNNELFQACLGGGGGFGIVYDADFVLRPCPAKVTTIQLCYGDLESWCHDQFELHRHVDYLEGYFILSRTPRDHREYRISIGVEHGEKAPPNLDFLARLQHRSVLDRLEQPVYDYVCRHDARFQGMRASGLWQAYHPWLECCVDWQRLLPVFEELIDSFDVSLGEIFHLFPIYRRAPKYFMLPEGEKTVTLNILTPGVQADQVENARQALRKVNDLLLAIGGKRYLSGWFEPEGRKEYWQRHYGSLWNDRLAIKQKYDPHAIYCSQFFG